jgi:type I restriction enzyme S subunit
VTWDTVPFDSAFVDVTSKSPRIKQSQFAGAGRFPVRDQGEADIAGYWSDESDVTQVHRPVVLFGADGVKVLLPSPALDPRFAYHWMTSLDIPSAGYSRHFKFLRTHQVPLPPLREQRRIAAILDEADALRRSAREPATALEHARAASFRVAQAGAASPQPLGTLVQGIGSGRSVVGSEEQSSTTRVLKISAVTSGAFRENEAKPLPGGYVPPSEHYVRAGDLLVSRANTEALVGASAYVWSDPIEPRVLPDKLWRLTLNEGVHPLYVRALIAHPVFRREVSRRASGSGGAMKNIGQRDYLGIPVVVATREKQSEFVEVMRRLQDIEAACGARLAHLDSLFASLQHRAFRGEL